MELSLMDDARALGILKYISPHESFPTDREQIEEALYRASEVCLFAFESGKQNFQEFSNAVEDLRRFCLKHDFDFGEYCHTIQNYATIESSDEEITTKTEENATRRYYL